jgi:hypothetical protein
MEISKLKSLLSYNPDDGKLTWNFRPDARSQFNGRYAGKEAFTSCSTNGYRQGEIFDKGYLAHRVAWAIHYGEWPKGEIDHINGIRDDNRIKNLRDVSRIENGQNLRLKKNNSSGYCGVSFHKQTGKWRARVKCNWKEIHLGLFDTPEKANEVVNEARVNLNFFESHGDKKEAPLYES